MATAAMGGLPARPDGDRNAFLVIVALIWLGVISGFGVDSARHIRAHGLDYPLIVHLHAVVFMGWMALLTAQVGLVRRGDLAMHRRLGVFAGGWAWLMLIVGPATAIVVDRARYLTSGRTAEFLAVQLFSLVGFAALTGWALWRRRDAAAHKRLMILGTLLIAEAGYARFLNDQVAALLPGLSGVAAQAVGGYFGTLAIAFGIGGYDLAARGRLYPAYLGGLAVVVGTDLAELVAMQTPAWKALSMRLIGF